MIILAVLVYLGLIIYDLLPLYKQKAWHDFWTYSVLGIISFTIAVLLCLEVKIPSPEKPIREFITFIFGK